MLRSLESVALRHLASIAAPSWMSPGKVLMGMLTAAFDASGDSGTPVLTVAGFISSEDDWRDFSEQWTKRLKEDGIEFFRAVNLTNFSGPFKHWHDKPKSEQEKLRRALCSDLMDILKRHVYRKFGCTVVNDAFEKMDMTTQQNFRLCAYSVAGRTCEKHVRQWLLRDWLKSETPVRIVFEDGDIGKGKLQYHLSQEGQIHASFGLKKDTAMEDGRVEYGYVPLQAADWYSYELSLAVRQAFDGKIADFYDFRWPMQQFESLVGAPGIYLEEDIQKMESRFKELDDISALEGQNGLHELAKSGKLKRNANEKAKSANGN
jgi:hypothetical protein